MSPKVSLRMTQLVVCTLVVVIAFPSCRSASRRDLSVAHSNPYFPVDSGRVWVYVDRENPKRSLCREVKATEFAAGSTFAVIEESECIEGIADHVRTWRFKIDSNGKIFAFALADTVGMLSAMSRELTIDTSRSLLFNTNARPGEQWLFSPRARGDSSPPPAISSSFHMRCEKRGEFTLSNGQVYNDCVLFSSDEHEDGVEYFLARGAGLVSIVSHAPGGARYELSAQKQFRR